MGILATIGLGLGGSFIGGVVAYILVGTAGGIIFSILGAILLLYLYRRFVQKRPLTARAFNRRSRRRALGSRS